MGIGENYGRLILNVAVGSAINSKHTLILVVIDVE